MSLTSSPRESSKGDRLRITKLENSAQFPHWWMQLTEYLFLKLHITNPTQLKREDTLDSAFFKKSHPVAFKAAIGIDAEGHAVVDADGKPVHPLYANTTFCDICFTFALKNGKGFHTWVYNIYIDIRACLSEEIYEKTSSVAVGDIVFFFFFFLSSVSLAPSG